VRRVLRVGRDAREPSVSGEYIGDAMPSWVRDGVKVKVKTNPTTRRFGLGFGNHKFWPGEVGVIRASQGNGWWDYRVFFQGVHFGSNQLTLDKRALEDLVKLPGQAKPGSTRAFRAKSRSWFERERDARWRTRKHGRDPAGTRCPVGTRVQTLLLSRVHFPSAQRARDWAHKHGFLATKVDPGANYFRLRQAHPKNFRSGSLRTIPLRPGVMAVVGCPR